MTQILSTALSLDGSFFLNMGSCSCKMAIAMPPVSGWRNSYLSRVPCEVKPFEQQLFLPIDSNIHPPTGQDESTGLAQQVRLEDRGRARARAISI